ncbi:hypothetical protein V2G26_010242 [Clonostachys chloroleuca]
MLGVAGGLPAYKRVWRGLQPVVGLVCTRDTKPYHLPSSLGLKDAGEGTEGHQKSRPHSKHTSAHAAHMHSMLAWICSEATAGLIVSSLGHASQMPAPVPFLFTLQQLITPRRSMNRPMPYRQGNCIPPSSNSAY